MAEPVSLVDLTPMLLDGLGLPPLEEASGRSLRAALKGEPLAPRPCYAETDEPYQTAHWSPLRALVTKAAECATRPRPASAARPARRRARWPGRL